MPNYPHVALKYFDCRGRAQFLRGYLLHRGIPFEDERVSLAGGLEAWQAIRADRMVTGPFQKLPVLRWGERRIAETTVIAAFLHRESGDAGRQRSPARSRGARARRKPWQGSPSSSLPSSPASHAPRS